MLISSFLRTPTALWIWIEKSIIQAPFPEMIDCTSRECFIGSCPAIKKKKKKDIPFPPAHMLSWRDTKQFHWYYPCSRRHGLTNWRSWAIDWRFDDTGGRLRPKWGWYATPVLSIWKDFDLQITSGPGNCSFRQLALGSTQAKFSVRHWTWHRTYVSSLVKVATTTSATLCFSSVNGYNNYVPYGRSQSKCCATGRICYRLPPSSSCLLFGR